MGSCAAAHGSVGHCSGREELVQKRAETPEDQLAILPWKLEISESFMQSGREAALLLERGCGVCVRDGHKSNLLIFVRMAEIGN